MGIVQFLCFDQRAVYNSMYLLTNPCSDESTFWTTTGMYPQETIIQLSHEGVLSQFRIVLRNGKYSLKEFSRGISIDFVGL